MKLKSKRGIVLFLLAMFVYAAVVFMSWYMYQEDPDKEFHWAKLDEAEARLLFRTYMFLNPLLTDKSSPPEKGEMLNEILAQASDSWIKALNARPDDVDIRFAAAVSQMEFDREGAITTILSAPASQQSNEIYLTLKELVLNPQPEAELLQQPHVSDYIHRNPAKRLWLASIYSRLGEAEKAGEQLQQGYLEALPYAIASLVIISVWWGLVPLIGLVCVFTLIRKKRPPSNVPPVQRTTASYSPQAGPQDKASISLGQASAGFLAWLILSFLLTGLIVEVLAHLELQRFNPPAMMASSFIAAFFAVALLRGRFGRALTIGWNMNRIGLQLRVAFAIFLLFPIGMVLTRVLQSFFERDIREPSVLMVAGGDSLLMRIVLLLAACVIIPLTEETIFRGLLFRGIRGRWGLFAGMVISSAIFAIGHLELFAALPLFIFSLGLAWSVERTGSIIPATIAHGLFNLFPLLLLNIMTL